MSICLVSAPTVAEFADPEEIGSEAVQDTAKDPQLGILSLAAVLERRGEEVRLVDLNRAYINHVHSGAASNGNDFSDVAAHLIVAGNSEVYGFSTICSSYPLTLRIAKAVKALHPQATILLGGPQASVVDLETLAAFPFVDLVLRGESEHTLPLLLAELRGARRLDQIAGLTYRVGVQPIRNPNAPVIADLDALPFPAYHLSQYLQNSGRASLELGRGCPFACTFCSTNDFFRRRFRLRSPQRVLQDMRAIALNYSIRHFELVHDMFTVDRHRVLAFCEAMISSNEGFTWSCSARTDCIDERLLELMARAGCSGIFYGVEVGSTKMQKIIDKHLDIERAREIIEATEKVGMASTVSLICGFPEETWDDIRQSLDIFMRSAGCPRSHPQVNLLAPLAATPLLARHNNDLVIEELCSCVSHQAARQDLADIEMILAHPEIFPNFYVIRTPFLERDRLLELREFTLMGLARFRWLLVAIDQGTSGLLDFFFAWQEHRSRIRPALTRSDVRQYYRTNEFCHDFTSFVGRQCERTPAIQALLEYQNALVHSLAAEYPVVPSSDLLLCTDTTDPASIPVRCERVEILELTQEIQGVIDALKSRKAPIPSRGRYFYLTRPVSSTSTRLERISDWMAYLLRLCNGRNTLAKVIHQFALQIPEVQKSLRAYVCLRLLRAAQCQKTVDVYRQAGVGTAKSRPRLTIRPAARG